MPATINNFNYAFDLKEAYDLKIRAFRAILNQAVWYETEKAIVEFLLTEFSNKRSVFFQFVDFCKSEFDELLNSYSKIDAAKIERLLDFYTALTKTGMQISWSDGYTDGKSLITG